MAKKDKFSDWQKDFIYLTFYGNKQKDIAEFLNISADHLRAYTRKIGLKWPEKVKVGDTFNKLTVIEELPICNQKRFWKCQCKCGNFMEAATSTLISGHSSSCGCGRLEAISNGTQYIPGWYFGQLKRNAKKRNIFFNLTIEDLQEILIQQDFKCALSNLPIKFYKTNIRENIVKTTASVDRIDSNEGYTKDNVQFLHIDINVIKHTYPQNYFIKLCYLVGKNFTYELDCELEDDFLRWYQKGGFFKRVRTRKLDNDEISNR